MEPSARRFAAAKRSTLLAQYRAAKEELVAMLESSARDGEACILLSQATRELDEIDEKGKQFDDVKRQEEKKDDG